MPGLKPPPATNNEPTIQKRRWPLLGVLVFLRRYPGAVAASVGLLLVNISIEMAQPQIIGSAITQLRLNAELGVPAGLQAFRPLHRTPFQRAGEFQPSCCGH